MIDNLLVIWQEVEKRQKYHIGTLSYNQTNDSYEFSYNFGMKRRGLEEAQAVGFKGIYEFELKEGVVISKELFHFFNKRLPNKKRADYKTLLNYFGLDQNTSKMEFLRRTKGRLATDNYELFAPIIRDNSNNTFELEAFIEGWQYYDGDKLLSTLSIGDRLVLEGEPNNEQDQFAVKVLTLSGATLGYIAAVYSEFISNVLNSNENYEMYITDKYPDAIPQMKVCVKITGSCTFQRGIVERVDQERELILI